MARSSRVSPKIERFTTTNVAIPLYALHGEIVTLDSTKSPREQVSPYEDRSQFPWALPKSSQVKLVKVVLDAFCHASGHIKMKTLSKVGRVTLEKSFLNTMPIYNMQNMWILEGVYDKINSLARKFIWGNNHYHEVN